MDETMRILPRHDSRRQRTSSLSKSVGFIGENPLLKDVVSAITLSTGQEVD